MQLKIRIIFLSIFSLVLVFNGSLFAQINSLVHENGGTEIAEITISTEEQVAVQQEHSGVVTEAETGEPLIGANILVKGTMTGAATDNEGRFSFMYHPNDDYTLSVTFVGYKTAELDLSPGDNVSNLSFELALDPFGLDEIVVTGIASRTSKAIAEVAVARINMEELADKVALTSLSSMVLGKSPGLTMHAAGGGIGAPFRFQIRSGGGLHGDSQPLIIVDGVRMQQRIIGGRRGRSRRIGVTSLNFLQPEEIASIEILKGPAGASAYGTDGSNGVVLVTTKRGKIGAETGKNWSLNYKGSYGWNQQAYKFTEWHRRTAPEINSFFRNGPIERNNLNVSGGTSAFRYFVSMDKALENYHIPSSQEDRSNYRINFDINPHEKVNFGVSAGYFRNEIEYNPGRLFRTASFRLTPGNVGNVTAEERARADLEQIDFRANQFTGSISTEYRPFLGGNKWLTGLSGRLSFGVMDRHDWDEWTNAPDASLNEPGDRELRRTYNSDLTYTGDVRYEYSFLGINASANAGTQVYETRSNFLQAYKSNFVTPLITTIGAGDTYERTDESSGHGRKAGIFTEHSFSYNNTYFWSAMLRRDYTSVLRKGHQSIYYPRFSGAVRLDRFDLIPETFQMLKLRLAYGETGILPGRTSAIPELFRTTLSGYGVGARISGVGNTEIRPEQVSEWEIGIEAEYRSLLSVDVSYYRQNAEDSIYGKAKVPSAGYENKRFDDNIGRIKGQGIESQVQVFFSGRHFGGWSFNLTNVTSWMDNEVVDLGGGSPYYNHGAFAIEEGYPRGYIHTFKGIGAEFDEDGKFFRAKVSEERVDVGYEFPPWYGSQSATLSAFGFTAYAMLEWKHNFWFMNDTLNPSYTQNGSLNLNADIIREKLGLQDVGLGHFEELTPGTQDYIDLANWWGSWGENWTESNKLTRGDYLKLRELSVSYNLNKLIPKLGLEGYVQGLTIGYVGNNLWTMNHTMFNTRGLLDAEGSMRNISGNVPEAAGGSTFIPLPQTQMLFVRVSL
jgi:TonB-dependent SusC/RagA subfamily outer membrane receptor